MVSQDLQTIKIPSKYANGYFTIINGVLVRHVVSALLTSSQFWVFNHVVNSPLAAAAAVIGPGLAWPGLAWPGLAVI